MRNWRGKRNAGKESSSKQTTLKLSHLFYIGRKSIGVYGNEELAAKTKELKQKYNERSFSLVRALLVVARGLHKCKCHA